MIQILLLSISIIPSLSSVPTQKINSFENRNVSTILIRLSLCIPFLLVSILSVISVSTRLYLARARHWSFFPRPFSHPEYAWPFPSRGGAVTFTRFVLVFWLLERRKAPARSVIPSISLESKIIARKHEIEKRVYDQLDVIRWRTWRTDEWRM